MTLRDEHPDRAFERDMEHLDEQRQREQEQETRIRHSPASDHAPILLSKLGSAYTTDEGQQVSEHALWRYECRCGWKGLAWYAGQERAATHYVKHLEWA